MESSEKRKVKVLTGKGNPKADLMIVGDVPTYYDGANGDMLVGEKYELLKSILDEVLDEDWEDFYRTTVVKIYTKDSVTDTMIQRWTPYLVEEILEVEPKVILTLGATAYEAIAGEKGMAKVRGKTLTFQLGDKSVKMIPTFAPAYVKHNDKYLKPFAEDINNAIQLSRGLTGISTGFNKTLLIESYAELTEVIGYIKQMGRVCFDFETTGLDVHEAGFRATVLSFSFQHGSAYVLPLFHPESPFTEKQCEGMLLLLKKEVFENPEIDKIAHNLKFDMHVAALYGIDNMCGRMNDTMLMHHLLDETIRHGLKDLTDEYFKEFAGYENVMVGERWDTVGMDKLVPYAGLDTDLTLRFCDLFESKLLEDMRLYTIYRNMTMPANLALWHAEHAGMLIDVEKLESNIEEAEELLASQEQELMSNGNVKRFVRKRNLKQVRDMINEINEKLEGCKPKKDGSPSVRELKYRDKLQDLKLNGLPEEPINFGSHVQLGQLLYDEQGFNYPMPVDNRGNRKAKTGKDVIEDLEDPTGFIEGLRVWRTISKMLSTYLRGILSRVDKTGYIHPSFLLHGTTTGRLACRNPNLQNVPNISKLTNEKAIQVVSMVKQVFSVPIGHTLIQADFAQAELRIIADYATEENMIEAYRNGEDIHAKTGAKFASMTLEELYNLDPKDIKRHRTNAKAGNFGLIYGMSPEGLVDYAKSNYGLRLTLKEAKKMRAAFFELYPELLNYHETYIGKAKKFGHVRTLYGRKRQTPEINNPDDFIRSLDERVAINSPIQGTAGEFTIFALALLHSRLDPAVKIVNTVHDSIIFYIPDNLLESALAIIKETMENLPNKQYFGTDLKHLGMNVDIEASKENWGQLQEYEEAPF